MDKDYLSLDTYRNNERQNSMANEKSIKKDAGAHYRYVYKGIKLDPARICDIYNQTDFMLCTIVKKALKAGERGHKDFKQDLLDIISAAERRLEMLQEDNETNK